MTIGFKKGGRGRTGAVYYVTAAGLDDYYISLDPLKQKEPVGTWYDPKGQLPPGMDIPIIHDGQVSKLNFQNLCRGRAPNGEQLLQQKKDLDDNHVALYDITFNAPKSVSVLWAAASIKDPEIAKIIQEAQKQATEKAIAFASERFGRARNGESVSLMGALWEHGSSRANDPQLHFHFTLLNIALCKDGIYRSVDPSLLLKNQNAIAAVYHNELAAILSDRLGVKCSLKEGSHVFEIDKVNEALCQLMSKRGNAINEIADEKEAISKAERDAIAIKTRQDKSGLSRQQCIENWNEEMIQNGFHPQMVLDAALQKFNRDKTLSEETLSVISQAAAWSLTDKNSVFAEKDIYQVMSVLTQGRLNSDQLIEAVDFTVKERLCYLGEQNEKSYFSTKEMIELEAEMLHLADKKNNEHILDEEKINAALNAHETISDEQKAAVRHACLSSDMVSIVEGSAGAGKSFSLGFVKKFYEDAGYEVMGRALSWDASNVMSKEAQIKDTKAIEGFIRDIVSGRSAINNKTVLIIDEAGLVGSRHMHKLLQITNDAGAKIILTGDSKQLTPVNAGGALCLLVDKIKSARIDTVYRQGKHVASDKDAYAAFQPMRDATLLFADGVADAALNYYDSTKSIHLMDTHEEALDLLFKDWVHDREKEPEKSQLIIANDNATVRELNEKIRDYLKAKGEIAQEGITIKSSDLQRVRDVEFCVGDRIMFRANDKDKEILGDQTTNGIFNRTRGEIEEIYKTELGVPMMRIKLDRGGTVEINCSENGYWDRKNGGVPIQHAYATTIYASQGMTVNRSYLMDSQSIHARLAYVGCSRHMESLHVYTHKEMLHSQMMSKLGADEYRDVANIERAEFMRQIATNWSRKVDKVTTIEFIEAQKRGETLQDATIYQFDAKAMSKAGDIYHQKRIDLLKADIAAATEKQQQIESAIKAKIAEPIAKPTAEIIQLKREHDKMSEENDTYKRNKELMIAAKKADVPELLKREGVELQKESAEAYRFKIPGETSPYLVFKAKSGDWMVHNPEAEKTYDAIGIIQEVKGIDFKTALAYLHDLPTEAVSPKHEPRERLPVRLRESNMLSSQAALRYAIDKRGISKETLQEARKQGFSRSDDRGTVFCGYDKSGQLRCAETRTLEAVIPAPGKTPTHKISAPGTDKTYSPILRGENPKEVHIVEGGFDALALRDMYKNRNQPTPTIIATLGGKITKFTESDAVRDVIGQAEKITIWKERERTPEIQAKTDLGHEKQKAAIEQVMEKEGVRAQVRTAQVPADCKDLAELNVKEKTQLKLKLEQAPVPSQKREEEEEQTRRMKI